MYNKAKDIGHASTSNNNDSPACMCHCLVSLMPANVEKLINCTGNIPAHAYTGKMKVLSLVIYMYNTRESSIVGVVN